MEVLDSTSDADSVGKSYESKLCLLLLYRHYQEYPNLTLCREGDDDGVSGIIFEYKENKNTVYRHLQVKHSKDYRDGDFDLIEYFISYWRAKNYYSGNGKIKDYVIYTNLSTDLQKKSKIDFERITGKDSIWDIENTGKESKRFCVKNPTGSVDQIKRAWKNWQGLGDDLLLKPEPSTEDIMDYLKTLIFVLGLPDENDLDIILENEIFKEMTNKAIYERTFWRMVDRIEAKDSRNFLDHEDAKDLFDNNNLIDFTLSNYVRYNVQTPVSLFTGRKEYLDLQGIHKLLQEKKRVVICGIGGVGKTELARKYIEVQSEKYNENILWINAENDDSLIKCFRSLASEKLKIEKISDSSEAENVRLIIKEVFDWFQNSKSLLILDDAACSQYKNYIEPVLSKTAYQPYIIITSRSKWEKENTVESIELNVFTESEATDFILESLSEFLNNDQGDSIKELGKALQYLPLALQQACAYINSEFEYNPETYQISEYIENLKKNCQEYLNYSLRDYCESGYAKTVWTTWDTTIQALQQEDNYALKILNCMSVLLSGGIHGNLLSKLFKEEQKLQKSIELLKKYLLITNRDNIYCLNHLVQLVIREKLQPDDKQEVLERISEAIVEKDETIARSIDHLVFAWMHLKEIFNLAPQLSEKYCHVLVEIALILFDISRHKEAYALGAEILKLMNPFVLKNEHEQQSVQNIAPIIVKFICNIGEQEESLHKAKTILEILNDMNKPLANTSSIFSIETDIISLCLKMADVHSAIKIFSESFLISMAGAKEHHIAIMLRTEILGDIFIELSEYDIALKVYCLIFTRRKSNSKTNDPNILRISKKIANTLSEAHINKQTRNPMYNLPCTSEKTNLANEVSSILWETYKNQKKIDPNNHSDLSEIQECIIKVLISQGKYKKALRRFENISNERLLKNNCNMLAKKAFVLALLGRSNDALATRDDLMKHILSLERDDFKEIYPSIVQSRVRLALVTSLLGKVDEALVILEEIWNRLKYSVGFYNIHVMNILNVIYNLYLRKNEHDEFSHEYIQCVEFTMPSNLGLFEINTSAMLLQLQQKIQSDATSHLSQNHDFDDWIMEETLFFKLDDEKVHHQVSGISVETKLNEKAFLNNDCRNKYVNFIHKQIVSKAIRLTKLKDPFTTVKSGNLAQLKKLIKEGVDVNTVDENTWTLLHYAAKADKPDIVACLLRNGADATRVTKEFENTLHIAVERNNLIVAKVLLNYNVETSKMFINAKTKADGVTALHIASKQGSLDMLRLLLSHGAIYDMKSKAGKSPLQMARDIIVGALFKEIDMRFRFFVTFKDDRVLEPLKNYPDDQYFAVFGARNDDGDSLLRLAVKNNCKNLVELILNFKATISTTIESLTTSLNIDSVLEFDRTISNFLHDDKISNLEYLRRMKSFVQLVRTRGKSMFWKFILSTIEDMLSLLGANELVKFVIEMQLKLLTELLYGAVLIDTAKRDDFKTFELCLEKTNFLDSFDMEGITPIHYAAMNGNKKMVELLLDRNVKSHCSLCDDGWRGGRELPPNCSRQGNNFSFIRFNMGVSCEVMALLGDLIASITPKKRTPLHLAVENHHIAVAKLLLERDSSYEFVNSSTENGSTALHLAVKNAHIEMIKLLLENHADCSITDDNELRPVELVEEKETKDLSVEEKKIKDLFIFIDELHDDADVERVLEKLSKIEPAERRPLLNAISAQGKMLRHIIVAKCKNKKKISDIIGNLSEQDSHSQADLARKLLDVMLEVVEKNKNICC